MADTGPRDQTVPPARILVVDDEPAIRETLQMVLGAAGHEVVTVSSGNAGLDFIARSRCDLVLLDLMLPDRPGLEVLAGILKINRGLPVIMLTAYGSIDTAVEATQIGARNFLTKPWNNSKLLLEIRQTLERTRLEHENARLRSQLGLPSPLDGMVAKSDAMLQIFVMIHQVARTRSTVLLSGESGTGKELAARAIHKASPRAERSFVTVNSARIPVNLLDSTLYGHRKGSFAGAIRDRRGCFEVAEGGTIFLDEIGNLSLETQAKLLRVIQEREVVPVGSNKPVPVDVRIIAASNVDLETAVQEGKFRRDLYYRLNVIGIELPPLRERMEDVPLLVEEFLTQICRRERNHFVDHNRRSTLVFTEEAQRMLMAHDWPGNVLELRNAVERAVVLATHEELGPELLPASIAGRAERTRPSMPGAVRGRPGASLAEMVEDFERSILEEELEKHGFNQTETAKSLRVALSTLNQKIQRLNITVRRRQRAGTSRRTKSTS